MITYLLFPLGFVLLIKGASALVEGASSLAKKLRLSDIVIGLTIVAFGTSAPELLININASITGSNEIALGNVIGSNISNILLILGTTAIIYPLIVTKGTRWKEIPLSLLATVAVFLMINDAWIDGIHDSALTRIDGIILLLFFTIFLYYTFGISKTRESEENPEINAKSNGMSITLIILGIVGLGIGGRWVVNGAMEIAEALGVTQSLIGLTLVALGGSAPELATSVMAAIKKNADIAIGNVVGSNIFNLFWVLGISAIIRPIPITSGINADIMILTIATFVFFIFTFTGGKIKHLIGTEEQTHGLTKFEGIIFLLAYASYITFLVYRG